MKHTKIKVMTMQEIVISTEKDVLDMTIKELKKEMGDVLKIDPKVIIDYDIYGEANDGNI